MAEVEIVPARRTASSREGDGRTSAHKPESGGMNHFRQLEGAGGKLNSEREREWGRLGGPGSETVTLKRGVSAAHGGPRPRPLSGLGRSPRPPEPWVGTGEGPGVTSTWPWAERLAIRMVTSSRAGGKPGGSEHGSAGTPGNAPESGGLSSFERCPLLLR